MKKMKKILAAVLLLALALCLTGCGESSEAKYSRAEKLLGEGKYDEAVKLLEELGAYGDAEKAARYAKAVLAAEGGDYASAIAAFKALGDYRDGPLMIPY